MMLTPWQDPRHILQLCKKPMSISQGGGVIRRTSVEILIPLGHLFQGVVELQQLKLGSFPASEPLQVQLQRPKANLKFQQRSSPHKNLIIITGIRCQKGKFNEYTSTPYV